MFPNLDAELEKKKITRAALAKILHRTPTTLSLKLNGKAPITLSECVEIKKVLGEEFTIEYLFSVGSEDSRCIMKSQ